MRTDAGEPTLGPGTTVPGSICVCMGAQSCPTLLRPAWTAALPEEREWGAGTHLGEQQVPPGGGGYWGPPLFFTDYLEDLKN